MDMPSGQGRGDKFTRRSHERQPRAIFSQGVRMMDHMTSDSIHQLLSHYVENILQIKFSCHSGHDASLPCLAHKVAIENTSTPPDFMGVCGTMSALVSRKQ